MKGGVALMVLSRIIDGNRVQTEVEPLFEKRFDIIVAGLGTAGAVSLITAAREGLHVLGVERLNGMGGTGTYGAIEGYYYGARGGFYESLNQKTAELQAEIYQPYNAPNSNAKMYILEQEALKYQAELLYESFITGVYLEGNAVKGLLVYSNGNETAVSAEMVIDCTGEADVCYMAGCAMDYGRKSDGRYQPYTNTVIACKNGRTYPVNKDAGYINPDNNCAFSQELLRANTLKLLLREQYDQEEVLITNAAMAGVREGRRIIGEKRLTFEACFNNKKTNPLFYAYSNADNHGKDTFLEDEPLQEWYVVAGLWGTCFSVGIPAGALIPKGFDGILAAGRCISVDHSLASCVRMKSDMEKCGEAAAMLACMAIQEGKPAKEISYQKIANRLEESQCLNNENDRGFLLRLEGRKMQPVQWLETEEEIMSSLCGTHPGLGIWSAKLLGDRIIPALNRWAESEDQNLQRNAALALGLLGVSSPILYEMALERDPCLHKTSEKYTYTRGNAAVYLLGRLHDRDALPLLAEIVRTKAEYPYVYQTDELYTTENDVRFQYFSYAVLSLLKIGEYHPDLRRKVIDMAEDGCRGAEMCVTLKFNPFDEYDMLPSIEDLIKQYKQKWFLKGELL